MRVRDALEIAPGNLDHPVGNVHAVNLPERRRERPYEAGGTAADLESRALPRRSGRPKHLVAQPREHLVGRVEKLTVVLPPATEPDEVICVFRSASVPVRTHTLQNRLPDQRKNTTTSSIVFSPRRTIDLGAR